MFTQARLIAGGSVLLVLLLAFGGLYAWGNSWHTKYQTLNSQNLAGKLAEQTARADALAQQITDRNTTLKNNAEVIRDLSTKHAADVANLGATGLLVDRLLHDAAGGTGTGGSAVSETDSGRAAVSAAADGSDGSLRSLLVRTSAEYWNHVRNCSALQAQIKPQL